MARRIDHVKRAAVKSRYEEGESAISIARSYGHNPNSIYTMLKAMGVPRRSRVYKRPLDLGYSYERPLASSHSYERPSVKFTRLMPVVPPETAKAEVARLEALRNKAERSISYMPAPDITKMMSRNGHKRMPLRVPPLIVDGKEIRF
jgi:transposase-like protein